MVRRSGALAGASPRRGGNGDRNRKGGGVLNRKKRIAVAALIPLLLFCFLYLVGLLSQAVTAYRVWLAGNGLVGGAMIRAPDFNPAHCLPFAFRKTGVGIAFLLLLTGGVLALLVRKSGRFARHDADPRGFSVSRQGTYGTAAWMGERECRSVLKCSEIGAAEGMLLGLYGNQAVSIPFQTGLNRHIAVFGASGTGKSRAVIRNALLQALKNGESVVVTDPKAELYADMAEAYRESGYEVRVFNLIDPEHSDSWNCMSDLHGDTLMAQVLTNIIIGNTGSAKGDHFWDNGEGNLLKALMLYVDQDPARRQAEKNLPAVYRLLTQNGERQLHLLFERLPPEHPARAPYSLFAQAGDTVRSGIILGLGTRLQVLQNPAVRRITERSDMDLTAPGKRKCAYFIILSDQDATMALLSSLFFSVLFIRLTRFADSCPELRCPIPVNLILDEFNNIGRLGGAADGSDFARSLSVVRSRDIRVMLAVQSLGQLQNRYPDNLWAEILGNCDIQLMLGCTDAVSAQYFSERSGEMSVRVDSTMTVRRTLAPIQMIPQYRKSEGEGKRRLLTPDEVLRLPPRKLLCVIRGQNLLLLEKLDYTEHPLAARLRRVSVHDYAPHPETAQAEAETEKATSEKTQTGTLYASAKPPESF